MCDDYGIPHSEFLGWSNKDRAKALAFKYEKNDRCQLCGTAPWEWEDNKHAYVPDEHFCLGCYMKHMANEDHKRLPGTTIELARNSSKRLAEQRIMEQKRRKMS